MKRLHRFDADELRETIDGLAARELLASIGRRPGQKEGRYAHLLADGPDTVEPVRAPPSLEERVARLESEVAELRKTLEQGVHAPDSPVKPGV